MRPSVNNYLYKHTFNPFKDKTANQPHAITLPHEEAVVVDVVLNEEHGDYSKDGYNVGCIKVRLIKTDFYVPDEKLSWAFPIESNISEYPLVDEIVIVHKFLDRLYYSKKLNTSSKVTTHEFLTLNNELQPNLTKDKDRTNSFKSTTFPSKQTTEQKKKIFKDIKSVFRLRHNIGDIIYEGRSGQTIRMGTSWLNDKYFKSTLVDQSPNILMRVGPNSESKSINDLKYGVVVEDINKDQSSLWMVSDQVVELEVSTKDSPVHGKSIADYPSLFDKNQILMNTDRLVINTKLGKVLIQSADGIHFTTLKSITVDTENEYVSWINTNRKINIENNDLQNIGNNLVRWVGGNISISAHGNSDVASQGRFSLRSRTAMSLLGPKIYIGSLSSAAQPIPLGRELTNLLIELIDACLAAAATFVLTGMGPGSLNPGVVSTLSRLRGQLQQGRIISDDNFVNKVNQTAGSLLERMNINP